jgi:two-component system, OmpR family, osmolarity sensor histidine kinase EnvZ
MRLWPRSLLWRTLIVLVAALVLSQAASLYLLHEYVTQPRNAFGMGQFVSHLKTISAALQTMTTEQQHEFIGRIAEKEGIRISPARGNEPMGPAADVPPVRMFRERVREIFGPEAEVYVRGGPESADEGGKRPRPQVLWIKLPAGEREFWVAFPRGRIERDPTSALLAWSVTGFGIAALATFFIVWRLNRPLADLARAADRVGGGADPPPVEETGPSEIRAVMRAFNRMQQGLKKSRSERATFLAGVSHDLRTPLARLRLELEMLEGRVEPATRKAMVEDLDDMNAIIDQFMDFMRSEAAEPLSAVNLAELARSCAERAARGGAEVRCELDELPVLMLRPLAMQRAIDNLLGNAARHAGGETLVRVRREDGRALLSVLDRGPGIPAELVERLKEPFTRRDESRSGSSGAGLGLAIASRVAELHGGRLDLLPREGGGLEAQVTLPMAE